MLLMSRDPCILAVDDEAFVLDILVDDLTDAGFKVMRAENGPQAIQTLGELEYCDAIVLDRMMPGMDGIEVLQELKATPQYKNIPVILQTADGQHEHIEESMKAGAYCYLVKPYNEKALLSAVQSAIKNSRKQSPVN